MIFSIDGAIYYWQILMDEEGLVNKLMGEDGLIKRCEHRMTDGENCLL